MLCRALAAAWITALSACGPVARETPAAPPAPRLVTTERGPRGGRLVSVAEDGTRLADLTAIEASLVIDSDAAFSPDGAALVFASSRGRAFPETSLYVMPARVGAPLRRLTNGEGVDRDPVWMPSARAILYASNAAGNFDLWLLPLDGAQRAAGAPRRLTEAPTDELAPSLSPDGKVAVYMALDRATGQSTLWLFDMDAGTSRKLTDGPADVTPAWSPDGKRIAFAAPVKGRNDIDVFLIDANGAARARLLDEPYADQTGPVWSADGHFLFATSLYRSQADGAPVLSSLVVLEVGAKEPRWRALHDPAAVESRVGIAVAPQSLAVDALRANPVYVDALRRAVRERLETLESVEPRPE